MNNINGNRLVLCVLLILFMTYNTIIYTKKTSASSVEIMSDSALSGEIIWQKNNCSSCHQLYGLGGYLGPDLTNIVSNPNKGANYAKAFLNSGQKSMPKFHFSDEEKEHLIQFLTHVDGTGIYPNVGAEFDSFGWVKIEYK